MAGVSVGHSGHVVAHNNRGIDVTLPPYRAKGDGVTDDTAAIKAAVEDAHELGTLHSGNHDKDAPGETWTVFLPPGIYRAAVDLRGMNVNVWGSGPASSRFRAPADHDGYVVDMRGWRGFVSHHRGGNPFGNFSIEGSYQPDPTLATGGLIMGELAAADAPGGSQIGGPGGYRLENISIFGTGGPAFKMMPNSHLGDISNLTVQRPVGADDNDVPYLHVFGDSNGVRWHNLGFRSVTSDLDGTKVAFWEKDESAGQLGTPNYQRIVHPWTEFTHTPSGGSVFWMETRRSLLDSPMPFDRGAESEPDSPHSFVRLASVGDGDNTSNVVRGQIPGGGESDTALSYGIIVETNGNRIVGPRGYRNNNVYLADGVGWNYVEFGGAEAPTNLGDTPWVDDSGETTNTLIDHNLRLWVPGPDAYSTGAD